MGHVTRKKVILYVAGLLLFTAVMGFATSDSCTFARMYMSVNNQADGDHTYQANPCQPLQSHEKLYRHRACCQHPKRLYGISLPGIPSLPLLPEYSAPFTGAGSGFRYQQDFVVHFAKLQLPL